MLVTRWQAPLVPDKKQIFLMFEAEGLQAFEEIFNSNTFIQDRRLPFDEVRMVAQGQVMMDIAGNKLLLRAGDKILIPSNTRHSIKVEGQDTCTCICARKTF